MRKVFYAAPHIPLRQAQRAFTLVELMVALVIVAIVSLLAFQGLSSIIRARDDLSKQQQLLRDQNRLITILEQDLLFLAKPERDLMPVWPIWISTENGVSKLGLIRDVTRPGEATAYQKIEYTWRDKKLERRATAWPVRGEANPENTGVVVVLERIQNIQFELYFPLVGWVPEYDPYKTTSGSGGGILMPTGLALRLFPLPLYQPPAVAQSADMPPTQPLLRTFVLNKP